MKYLFAIITFLVLFACKQDTGFSSNAIKSESDKHLDAIALVFTSDDSLGTVRNLQPMDDGLSVAIQDYTAALNALEFQSCPVAFKDAFTEHIKAWEDMLEVTIQYDDMRGEMHDLFDKIELSKDSSIFKEKLDAIWNSWYPVEDFKMDESLRYTLFKSERSIDSFFHYLQGSWKHQTKDVFEIWKMNEVGELLGEGISLKEGNKVVREKLRLEKIEDSLNYIAMVPDQNEGREITFSLNTNEAAQWSFENLNHDFPKRIIYVPQGLNRLLVKVKGDGEEGFEINFVRN